MRYVVTVLLGWGVLLAGDTTPEGKSGPKVGTKAPAFTLKDQAGKERSLEALLKSGPVALVFYRSALW